MSHSSCDMLSMEMEVHTCERCGENFTPKHWGRPGRYCSLDCYYAIGPAGPRREMVKHRMKTARGHPLAPPSGVVAIARLTLFDKIGPGSHACHWCGEIVSWKPGHGLAIGALLADHLDWDATNDAPENLVPSCRKCNVLRTRNNHRVRIQEGETISVRGGQPRRAINRQCITCGSGFTVGLDVVKRGHGHYCSRSCARQGPRKPKLEPNLDSPVAT